MSQIPNTIKNQACNDDEAAALLPMIEEGNYWHKVQMNESHAKEYTIHIACLVFFGILHHVDNKLVIRKNRMNKMERKENLIAVLVFYVDNRRKADFCS